MEFDYKIQKISHNEYDKFTKTNICSVFQKTTWIDCAVPSKHYSKLYLGGFKENLLISVCCFIVRGCYPLYMVGSPMKGLYTEIGGPVFIENIALQEVKKFVYEFNEYIMMKYNPVFFQFTPDVFSFCYSSMVESIQGKMQLREKIGHSALITPSETLEIAWSRLEGRARTAIRKARNNNITISIVDLNEDDSIKLFYDLYKGTLKRRGLRPRHSYMFFKSISTCMESDLIKLVVAIHEKKVVSAGIFMQDRDRIIYLAGASSPDGLKLSAQSLVLWDRIEYCTKRGLTFDLGGLGDSGIDKFKESFGGKIYQKMSYVHVNRIISWIVFKIFKINF